MRVLIVDDHALLRDTLISFISAEGDMEGVSAGDIEDALKCIEKQAPFDLILLDYSMPKMNGLDGLKRMMSLGSGQRVALMSGLAPRDVAQEALSLGAAGFLPKTLPAKRLVNAVRFMATGEQYAPINFITAEPEAPQTHPLAEKLSQREMQMLEGLSEGKSNKEIARELDLTEPTIKLHMKTLYRKLRVCNRTQAALLAKDAKLF